MFLPPAGRTLYEVKYSALYLLRNSLSNPSGKAVAALGSFAVLHMQKMKMSDVKGIQIEAQRESKNLKNPDIDFEKSGKNYDLFNPKKTNFSEKISDRIAKLHTDKLSEIIGEAYNAGKSGVEMKFDSKDHYTSALAAVSDGSANNAIANVYLSSGIFNYQTWYLSYDDLYVIQEIWKN
jgi:hypothetical protein